MGKTSVTFLLLLYLFIPNITFGTELVVARGDENYPPDEVIIDNKLVGFHIELLEQAGALIDVQVTFRNLPWARALSAVIQGEVDAITYISKTPEREKHTIFLHDNIISESTYYFLECSDRESKILFNGELEELEPYIIGIQRGYAYNREFDQSTSLKKLTFNNVEQMISLLTSGRIDLAILTEAEHEVLKHTDEFKRIRALHHPLTHTQNYIAFSKKRELDEMAERFSQALKTFKQTEAFQQLKIKYNKP